MHYQVVVGNIGTVYQGDSIFLAMVDYSHYLRQSVDNVGRGGNEEVIRAFNPGKKGVEHGYDKTAFSIGRCPIGIAKQ